MNELDEYILECYKSNKKISGVKVSNLSKICSRKHSNETLFSLAKNITIPKCSVCDGDVKLLKDRTFSVYCGIGCQKSVLSEKNKNENASLNKNKSEKVRANILSKLIEAEKYYLENDISTIKTVSELFGLTHSSFRNFLKERNTLDVKRQSKVFRSNNVYKFKEVNSSLLDEEWIQSKIEEGKILKDISQELGASVNYIAKYLRENLRPYPRTTCNSSYENIIKDILEEYDITYIKNDRTVLNGKELDFYIPDHNIAIEVNGSYYHQTGEDFKHMDYHKDKTEMCETLGIRLIHFFDYQFDNIEKIKSLISSSVGKNKIIYARKCDIREISSKDFRNFCNINHMQNSVDSSIRYGLFCDDELVAVMGFCKSRFDKKIDYEITRYCSKMFTNVVGGPSKLFRYFIKKYSNRTIISYCNRQYFSGKMYTAIGMTYTHASPPNYVWVSRDCKSIKKRYQTQKHKLNTQYSENDYMKMNKYYKVHDSGQKVFIYGV